MTLKVMVIKELKNTQYLDLTVLTSMVAAISGCHHGQSVGTVTFLLKTSCNSLGTSWYKKTYCLIPSHSLILTTMYAHGDM